MSTLAIILVIVLILCLAGGGWGYRSGAIDGNIPSLLYLIVLILIVFWLLRVLGIV